MAEAPRFFIPVIAPEDQESFYADCAKACHREVPPLALRIYSITFIHDGAEWTATVGEPLRGFRVEKVRSERGIPRLERREPVKDPAVVLAIFPGDPDPYMVVTNQIAGNVGSAWESPFMAGRPTSVTHFSLPGPA